MSYYYPYNEENISEDEFCAADLNSDGKNDIVFPGAKGIPSQILFSND